MKAFSPRRTAKRDYERELARNALALNPCPARSTTELMRIRRALDGIKDSITYWMLETIDQKMKWMPYKGTITDQAEEHYYLAKSIYDSSPVDKYGYLLDFHNPKQRATNRISVASWYTNNIDKSYYIVKIIHSPIPCETWGWLPLSRKHWNVIALEIMAAHQDWQWIHAVRERVSDESMQPGSILGWHMERAKKIYTKDNPTCTSQVIYRHVIQKYLELEDME